MSEMEHHEGGGHSPVMNVLHGLHGLHSGIEGTEGILHAIKGVHAGAQGSGLQVAMGILGIPLGGLSMGVGIDEMSKGKHSQGLLDIVSGGLGMASGVAGIAAGAGMTTGIAAAATPLAIAAGLAGLGAYGNEDAQNWGLYGEDNRGGHATFLDSIGQKATGGWGVGMDAGHGLLGDNIAGDIAGGVMGGVLGGFGGLGQTILNSGAAVGMGARKLVVNDAPNVLGMLNPFGGAASTGAELGGLVAH